MQVSSANYWLRLGASAAKLNIGLPLYGRTFTLRDPNVSRLGAPATGAGKAGPFTQAAGFLAFYEVTLHHTTRPTIAYYYTTTHVTAAPSPCSAVVLIHDLLFLPIYYNRV